MPEEIEGRTPLAPPPSPTTSPTPSPPLAPGWHPDPSGRFDVRYHNGFAWTHDVARDGQRFVDSEDHRQPTPPVAPPPPAPAKNPIATAALVLGICSICLAWMPVLVVAGGILAALALIFGGVGLRRARERDLERNRAVVGLVTGAIGLALVAVGVTLTVVLLGAVDRFENPAAAEVSLESCRANGTGDGDIGTWRATGEITNVDDRAAEFSVKVLIREAGRVATVSETIEEIDRLEPGETATFDVSGRRTIRFEPECEIEVYGPLVFGIDISE